MNKNQRLLDHMARFAKLVFERVEEVQPMWLLEDADGKIQPIVTPFSGSESKEEAANLIKLALVQHKAVRYGFMAEAWSVVVDKQHPDFNKTDKIEPSGHRDRREIVNLVVEDDQGDFMHGRFFILRPEVGKPSLSPFKQEEPEKLTGSMTHLFQKIH
jgi:hypothetical protein